MERYDFSFVDYRVIQVNFALTGESPERVQIQPVLEIDYEKKGSTLELKIGVSFENPKAPFVFHVRLVGFFEFNNNVEGVDLNDVAKINCAAILYPFVRETVAELTRRSGFPPLLLPPVNFVTLFKQQQATDQRP